MLRRLIKLDWILITSILLLLGVGILVMYSLSTANPGGTNIFLKQLVFSLIGLGAMIFFALTDYHYFRSYSRKVYFLTIIVLLAVLFFGITLRGTSGWLGIGNFSVQPVEFAKIALIIFLASFISKKKTELGEITRLSVSLILTAVIVFLVLKQPDLGSSLILVGIWMGIILLSGISRKSLVVLLIAGIIMASLGWFFLADYQKARIQNLVNPESDPRGTGYNVIQSMVAVGSGGIKGKGIGHGSQSQLNFLPEKHTDFVFAVITEELGIIGSFFVFALYLTILFRIKRIATSSQDNFGYLLASGVMVMIFSQLFINVGMNIGVVPVTGIPLPLLSYGGSSLVAILISLGIVLNVGGKKMSAGFG